MTTCDLLRAVALMRRADDDHDGTIDFEEFEKHMWFIIEAVWDKGERDMDGKHHTRRNTTQSSKITPELAKLRASMEMESNKGGDSDSSSDEDEARAPEATR